jgi:hypothetical protein
MSWFVTDGNECIKRMIAVNIRYSLVIHPRASLLCHTLEILHVCNQRVKEADGDETCEWQKAALLYIRYFVLSPFKVTCRVQRRLSVIFGEAGAGIIEEHG